MRVLSLDTTTRAGSVALVDDHRVLDERAGGAARAQAERLPGEILALLAAHHWDLPSLDLFAVASGPGSFTGLRIGIATIQGLAFVEGRPVAAVSALEALGQIGSAGGRPGDFVGAWIDAHRQDVFSALYRVGDAAPFEPGRLVEVEAAAVGSPVAALARWAQHTGQSPVTFIGDGAVLHRSTLEEPRVASRRVVAEIPALAGAIGRMAMVMAESGHTTSAAGVQPLYVRRPDAEIERERRAAAKPVESAPQ